MKNIIEAIKISKVYNTGGVETKALSELSFTIKEGSFTVILGPSGAGKTTLLNLIGGMDYVSSGDLLIDGKNISKFTTKDLTLYRRNDVGFVFQFYNLMPNLTACENVELAVEVCKDALDPIETLNYVGLPDKINNFPTQLSGGQQQRVSIARAIAKNPKIMLCDEPTGALDYQTGKSILSLLQNMSKTQKKTVIIVTHNANIKELADQIIYVKDGCIDKIEYQEKPKSVEEIEW